MAGEEEGGRARTAGATHKLGLYDAVEGGGMVVVMCGCGVEIESLMLTENEEKGRKSEGEWRDIYLPDRARETTIQHCTELQLFYCRLSCGLQLSIDILA